MFCTVMASMNRSEQEQLYRQSREVLVRASSSGEAFTPSSGCGEEFVLSVLKSPVTPGTGGNHHHHHHHHRVPKVSTDEEDDTENEERRRLRDPSGGEDDTEDTDANINGESIAPDTNRRFTFFGEQLRRFRQPRVPRFGEAHHKRVPTPIKKKRHRFNDGNRHYGKQNARTKSEDLDGDIDDDLEDDDDDDDGSMVEVVETVPSGKRGSRNPPGVPDPYYPIYLPIDQAFKAKYVFHHKKGKTFQERVYVFLEHPGGWMCFIYHFTV